MFLKINVFFSKFLFITLLLLLSKGLFAQEDSISYHTFEAVTVSVQRLETKLLSVPASITSLQTSKIKNARRQLSINEYLNEIPGLFALNPNNFAQDLRVSIRGFGARSSFGIRGVKILVDGIPETTPDGQGQVDNLDLGLLNKLEIIRGPSSGLYGNASGGVISIQTQDRVNNNFIELGTTLGSFNLQQYQLKGGLTTDNTDLIINASHNRTDGYRDQSELEQTTLTANLRHQFSERSNLKLILNYTNSPTADDPGGIDLESVEMNRQQARDRNILFQTGEAVKQFKAAVLYHQKIKAKGQLQAKAYYANRDFYGLLPFGFGGIIDLNRHYGGQGLNYTWEQPLSDNRKSSLQVGYDFHFQRDHRQRYFNLEGVQGDPTLNQIESFSNFGLFLTNHLELTKQLRLNTNLRYDINNLKAEDRKLDNGDDSGDQQFNRFNIGLGASYELASTFIPYINFSTSFETPTLNELSANPTLQDGFNEELEPQNARNIELGVKGLVQGKLKYELVYFNIRTENEILSYEVNDQDFFRNAGQTTRNGLETSIQYAFAKKWRASASYTFSDFTFDEYVAGNDTLSGEFLPGIPKHFGALSLQYINPKGLFFKLQSRFVGKLFTNDSNTVEDDAYTLVNLNIGYEQHFSKLTLIPFFGINNLLDATYNDNIRINAFGGRFYEPAAGINFYGGVRVRFEGK